MHYLTEKERLLVLKYQDSLNKMELFKLINDGRKAVGEPLLPKGFILRMQIVPLVRYKGHPLEAVLESRWVPSKDCPLSIDYIRQYGEDYLLGYLDGFEDKEYGYSATKSESYVRAYVDGYKERLRQQHLKKQYFIKGRYRPN